MLSNAFSDQRISALLIRCVIISKASVIFQEPCEFWSPERRVSTIGRVLSRFEIFGYHLCLLLRSCCIEVYLPCCSGEGGYHRTQPCLWSRDTQRGAIYSFHSSPDAFSYFLTSARYCPWCGSVQRSRKCYSWNGVFDGATYSEETHTSGRSTGKNHLTMLVSACARTLMSSLTSGSIYTTALTACWWVGHLREDLGLNVCRYSLELPNRSARLYQLNIHRPWMLFTFRNWVSDFYAPFLGNFEVWSWWSI